MRRTLIIGAISATTLTLGLGVGATLAASNPKAPTSINSVAMTGSHMGDVEDMTAMMNGSGMAGMMDANGMAAMHTAMHEALAGTMPADTLAACDAAHSPMSEASTPSSNDAASTHAAHHPGD